LGWVGVGWGGVGWGGVGWGGVGWGGVGWGGVGGHRDHHPTGGSCAMSEFMWSSVVHVGLLAGAHVGSLVIALRKLPTGRLSCRKPQHTDVGEIC
jgi:hypothetical protein